MTLSIKPVTTIEECRIIEDLQRQIWHTEDLDIVPDHLIITIAKNGGVVLLARENDRPVGFCYGFQAETKGGLRKHASHQTGVLPGLQSRQVGYRIKLAQREAVLAQGTGLMSWTFDPLLSLNANLNIGKLGTISNIYYPELYGEMRAAINMGLESDRLEVIWRLTSSHVTDKISGFTPPSTPEPGAVLNPARFDERDIPILTDAPRPLSDTTHYLQLPTDIQAIKQADMPLAMAWQQQIRSLFLAAFAAGYIVGDFVWHKAENKSYYLITREDERYENRPN